MSCSTGFMEMRDYNIGGARMAQAQPLQNWKKKFPMIKNFYESSTRSYWKWFWTMITKKTFIPTLSMITRKTFIPSLISLWIFNCLIRKWLCTLIFNCHIQKWHWTLVTRKSFCPVDSLYESSTRSYQKMTLHTDHKKKFLPSWVPLWKWFLALITRKKFLTIVS